MTIYDIAKECKVSTATVSRVINNLPGVKKEVRKLIELFMEQNGYVPNLQARELSIRKTHIIGIVMPGINDYFTRRIEAVNQVTRQSGYNLMITANSTNIYNPDEELSNLLLLYKKQVDGILFFSSSVTPRHIKSLEKISRKIPVVIVDNEIQGLDIPSVVQDNEGGARKALYHLIKKGYQRIGMISGPDYDTTSAARVLAWERVLKENGLSAFPQFFFRGNFQIESGYRVILEFLKKKPEILPDALFAANDHMAMGAMKALGEFGIKIPDDMALIGFDDIETAAFLQPGLTTVRQDQYEVGKQSAKLLLELISQKKSIVRKIVLDQELIIRGSTR